MSNPLTRNFPERMLILPPSRTKTDTPHLMPLSEPAMAVLKSVQQNGSEFVFPTVTGLKIANWGFCEAAARQHAWQGGAAVARV